MENKTKDNNVVALLARAAAEHGSRTALMFREAGGCQTRLTFGELWESVDHTGSGLRAAGLEPGDRAILMIPMSTDLYVLLLAVLKCGAAAVFVDPWVGRRQIAAFASFAQASAWIGVPKSHLLRLIDPALRRIPLSVTTGRRWCGLVGRFALSALRRHQGDGRIAAVAPDDPALITFTSGSSGIPKGVERTHRFLAAQHAALQEEFPQEGDDVDMPMFPVFALNNLARGIPSIIPAMDFRHVDRVDAAVIAEQMHRHRVTTCTASPPFLDRLAEYQRGNANRRIVLRRILTGGAPVSDRQLAAWREAWPDTQVTVVYGSTEAEPVAHIDAEGRLALAKSPRRPAPGYCIGRPSHLVQLRVVRIHKGAIALDNGGWDAWEVPRGEPGELIVSGDHVARRYFRNAAATEENKIVDAAGVVWHRMGDTGYVDPQGYVWLVGRVHSTIWRCGEPVHPQLIEQAGAADDANLRIAAVGLSDEELGERVVVVVETAPGCDTEVQVRRRIEDAGLPVDEVSLAKRPLPLDPRHRSKIDYPALRERLLRFR